MGFCQIADWGNEKELTKMAGPQLQVYRGFLCIYNVILS